MKDLNFFEIKHTKKIISAFTDFNIGTRSLVPLFKEILKIFETKKIAEIYNQTFLEAMKENNFSPKNEFKNFSKKLREEMKNISFEKLQNENFEETTRNIYMQIFKLFKNKTIFSEYIILFFRDSFLEWKEQK